jgi:hypothetical protein
MQWHRKRWHSIAPLPDAGGREQEDREHGDGGEEGRAVDRLVGGEGAGQRDGCGCETTDASREWRGVV